MRLSKGSGVGYAAPPLMDRWVRIGSAAIVGCALGVVGFFAAMIVLTSFLFCFGIEKPLDFLVAATGVLLTLSAILGAALGAYWASKKRPDPLK